MHSSAVTLQNAKRDKAIHENPEEYLTIAETADRLKLSPKTIKNKMAAGIFKKGIHYFSPVGMAPRFKWRLLFHGWKKANSLSLNRI